MHIDIYLEVGLLHFGSVFCYSETNHVIMTMNSFSVVQFLDTYLSKQSAIFYQLLYQMPEFGTYRLIHVPFRTVAANCLRFPNRERNGISSAYI